jgi:replication-associated recombination protein RarA
MDRGKKRKNLKWISEHARASQKHYNINDLLLFVDEIHGANVADRNKVFIKLKVVASIGRYIFQP